MEFLSANPMWLVPLVFLARVADVSLGTFRTIVVFRGHKWLAVLIGFFETLIWLVAAAQVLKDLNHWYLAVAYAGGFAAGNYVGMWLEARFAIGTELIRCISYHKDQLAEHLREQGYQAISIDGDMGEGKDVEVIFIIEKRKKVPRIINAINAFDPGAIYSISDIKSVYDGPPEMMPRSSFLSTALPFASKRR